MDGRIDVVTLPPSTLSTLNPDQLPSGLRILSAGEALPEALAERWAASHELRNAYGPTESTVCTTIGRYSPGSGRPHIGTAVPGQCVHIRDDEGTEVPAGTEGMLWIGGAGLAEGYHKLPELTARQFVAAPPCAHGRTRFYRSGDLARQRPDGALDLVGRADDQHKIRGFRIELGEIESVLLESAGVRQATVVVREDRPGDKRIIAYVVLAAEDASDVQELLARRLPEYMRPSRTITLDALPTTVNGKIDRERLPLPDLTTEPVLARLSPTEATIAEIWTAVLGIGGIGPQDDFFDLGGDSLLIAKANTAVHERLGVQLSAQDIYSTPVLTDLANLVERSATADSARRSRRPLRRLLGRKR